MMCPVVCDVCVCACVCVRACEHACVRTCVYDPSYCIGVLILIRGALSSQIER